MNKAERIKMVKSMEFIVRNLNDEELLDTWFIVGVADGEISYGSLDIADDDLDNLECYTDDETFADLMDTFLRIMGCAREDGGLYCDEVLSKASE